MNSEDFLPDPNPLLSDSNFSVLGHSEAISAGDPNYTDNGVEPTPIYFPRAATLLAAVSSIIFIVIGVSGKQIFLISLSLSLSSPLTVENVSIPRFYLNLSYLFPSTSLPLYISGPEVRGYEN